MVWPIMWEWVILGGHLREERGRKSTRGSQAVAPVGDCRVGLKVDHGSATLFCYPVCSFDESISSEPFASFGWDRAARCLRDAWSAPAAVARTSQACD